MRQTTIRRAGGRGETPVPSPVAAWLRRLVGLPSGQSFPAAAHAAPLAGQAVDAPRAGNTPEDKPREAAEEVAAYENWLGSLESDLRLLKWVVGFNIALTAAVVIRLFA